MLVDATEQPVSTYGVIRGAGTYLAGVTGTSRKDLLDYGYVMEHQILHAMSLGISSCWLAGFFQKSRFAQVLHPGEGEIIPAVISLGYAADKTKLMDTVFRTVAGSGRRKPWNKLFFLGDFSTPASEEMFPMYRDALEAVRLAPSALNRQPWVVLYDQGWFHFYKEGSTQLEKHFKGMDVHLLDMGIAFCHFSLVLQEQGMSVLWEHRGREDAGNRCYMMSCRPSKQ